MTAQAIEDAEDVAPTDPLNRLSQRDFARVARYVQEFSGIQMPPTKLTMVEGRLRRRVRATGLRTLSAYCRYVFDEGGLQHEAVHLIDAVTTNKTDFFREPEHFRILTDSVLPRLVQSRRVSKQAPLKLWSAASSTGAEAYTLAMVLAEFARSAANFAASVLATDICTEVLQIGARAIYPAAMMTPVPADLQRRYVMRARNTERGEVRIVPELRSMVRFAQMNLMDASYGFDRDMDVIFCRNILIYFNRKTQEEVLQRLCRHLRPGGFLFLGHSESSAGMQLPLRPVGNTIFCRT